MKYSEIAHIYLLMGQGAFLANVVMLSSQFSIISKPQHLKKKKYNNVFQTLLPQTVLTTRLASRH